jgi:MYXO-CTERM domain-containing protein
VLALSGDGWAVVALIPCVAVLVRYSRVFGSPLGLLLTVVLIGLVEFLADFGAAMAETCGGSGGATAVEQSGAGLLLLALGGFGAHRRRVIPIVGAIVVAALWVAVVAHLVPGGAGGCFE